MALVLEIEHLAGVCFAARGPDSDVPDWPIQPDRAFSALVASWAARGCDAAERGALAWLEGLEPPSIQSADAAPRTAPTVFVPPNDTKTRLGRDLGAMLGAHGRQPRRFPAVAALDRDSGLLTRMIWPSVDGVEVPLAALDAVARDTAYVGHSSSLTRCRFSLEDTEACGQPSRRRVYSGRLDELERAFQSHRRPTPGETVEAANAPLNRPQSAFGSDWLVLEIVAPTNADGRRIDPKPDVRIAPVLAKRLRDTLMSGYGRANLPVPEFVSGHAEDGAASTRPHLAVAALSNMGFPYSDAAVHGFALIPPRGVRLLDDPKFRHALATVAPYDRLTRSRQVELFGEKPRLFLKFGGEATGLTSLDPYRYLGPATTWATATPLILERHLKGTTSDDRREETEEAICRACENIGLPRPAVSSSDGQPDRLAVLADKHSAISAAPPSIPSSANPRWMRWRLPERLASRALTHAVIRFPEPVEGPVILGAGRFVGLGLCLPLDRTGP